MIPIHKPISNATKRSRFAGIIIWLANGLLQGKTLRVNHLEGRSWRGSHHHVTLVAMAYSFLVLEGFSHKKTSGWTLEAVRRWMQKWPLMFTGICPVCGRKVSIRKISPNND